MRRLVVPFVGPMNAEVYTAIAQSGWSPTSYSVERSERAYFDLLAMLWASGEPFIVCEHDIVPHATAFDELAACPHDWCAFPFEYLGEPTYGLGCVKFSADLIARNPDAMTRVGRMYDMNHPKRHWCRLDGFLTCVLEGAGEERHKHETMVRHLNSGRSHDCTTA